MDSLLLTEDYAPQYGKPCVIVADEAVLEPVEVMDFCHRVGAIYDDGEDDCYVVQLPDRPQELYTKEALICSLKRLN